MLHLMKKLQSLGTKLKYLQKKNEYHICLNIVGAYDDCVNFWPLERDSGSMSIKMPKFAGHFLLRILEVTQTGKNFNNGISKKCVGVSQIIKSTSSFFKLIPNS